MLNYILKPVRHESFYKKYAGKRFMKVCFNELRMHNR
jgi:G2/mitotic-specific cyclin 1/2